MFYTPFSKPICDLLPETPQPYAAAHIVLGVSSKISSNIFVEQGVENSVDSLFKTWYFSSDALTTRISTEKYYY